jgi:hypothetical protein
VKRWAALAAEDVAMTSAYSGAGTYEAAAAQMFGECDVLAARSGLRPGRLKHAMTCALNQLSECKWTCYVSCCSRFDLVWC